MNRHVGWCALEATPPATTLSLASLRQIVCSKAGWAKPYTRTLRFSVLRFCFAIQGRRLLVRSSPAARGPLHVISQYHLFLSCRVLISFQAVPKNGSAMRRERGPATETKSGGERTLIAANGPRSQSKIVAQERLQPCGCRALPTPPPSTRFGKARWGSRGQAGD